jgi:hypothetical protein
VEELGYGESRRSFAGAADGEIAQTNNRQAGWSSSCVHPQCRRGAIKCGERN